MQRLIINVLFSIMLIEFPLMSAGQQTPVGEQTVVAFAEKAGIRALSFRQGDAAGFARGRNNFTDAGWKEFMKNMQGFLDEKGAPTFTSSFVASGGVKVLSQEDGVVRVRIPGTLTQSNNIGKTTYRAALEVTAGGEPVRIQKLEPIACAGASKACE